MIAMTIALTMTHIFKVHFFTYIFWFLNLLQISTSSIVLWEYSKVSLYNIDNLLSLFN